MTALRCKKCGRDQPAHTYLTANGNLMSTCQACRSAAGGKYPKATTREQYYRKNKRRDASADNPELHASGQTSPSA